MPKDKKARAVQHSPYRYCPFKIEGGKNHRGTFLVSDEVFEELRKQSGFTLHWWGPEKPISQPSGRRLPITDNLFVKLWHTRKIRRFARELGAGGYTSIWQGQHREVHLLGFIPMFVTERQARFLGVSWPELYPGEFSAG